MRLSDVEKQVAEKYGVPVCVVRSAYSLYWKNIREHLSSLNIKDSNYTEEEFSEVQNCCNLPYFGKMGVSWDRYRKRQKIREFLNKLRKSEQYDKTEES